MVMIKKMPNHTGSKPEANTNGKTTGKVITMADKPSKAVPKIRYTTSKVKMSM